MKPITPPEKETMKTTGDFDSVTITTPQDDFNQLLATRLMELEVKVEEMAREIERLGVAVILKDGPDYGE